MILEAVMDSWCHDVCTIKWMQLGTIAGDNASLEDLMNAGWDHQANSTE